jgi:hypothetical protein
MSRLARERASKLREYRDRLQEWKETRSPDAAKAMIAAMRKQGQPTYERAVDENMGQLHDEDTAGKALMKEFNVTITKREEKKDG